MRTLSNESGFTLTELLIVLVIIVLLLSIATLVFVDWNTKYNVESEIKGLYADIMSSRAGALTRNRMHFFQIGAAGTSYTVIADTDPAAFGDGNANTGNDTVIMTKNLAYPLTSSIGIPVSINFDSRGIIASFNPGETEVICVNSNANPDYNCLVVSQSRVSMGKLLGGGCAVINCIAK
ncbi:MAG TPA: prepilin-type N-terminal cleavage/methylation domain-containing protein [Dissulfurispiraceae bacterium]|nr:prepilin-type N-terminal cleavage/methylation domain-containing protein [Dissulfurispiraceae bacterium]